MVQIQPLTARSEPPPRNSAQRTAVGLGVVIAVLTVGAAAMSLAGLLLEQHKTERATYPAGISLVDLDLGSGDAVVVVDPRTDVLVERRITWSLTRPRPDERLENGSLHARARCGSWFGSCDLSYTVHVPTGTSVHAVSGSGNVRLTGVAEPVARTGSGNVEIRAATGALAAHSGSGNVRVVGGQAPVAALDTGSGNVSIEGAAISDLTARTGSGNVTIGLVTAPGRLALRSGSGDVDARLPDDGAPYAVTATTGSGDSHSALRNDPQAARKISVRTGSGNVRLRYKAT